MCIIVYKPKDVKMPDCETLKNCFNNNDDGAGYMYAAAGKVHIVKGLMTYGRFIESLVKTVSQFGQYIPYVIHFRWSTQAGVRRDCTHPYPLSTKMTDLRKLKTDCDIGVAHNGIISLTSSIKKDITYNDTMEFITDYLSLIIKRRDYYKDADTVRLIDRLSESRLAILDSSGHCELTGIGWIKDNGVFYSNEDYLLQRLTHHAPYLTDDYCPMLECGDDTYCSQCENFDYCFFDKETDDELLKGETGRFKGYLERRI
jgi:hypothetical protein